VHSLPGKVATGPTQELNFSFDGQVFEDRCIAVDPELIRPGEHPVELVSEVCAELGPTHEVSLDSDGPVLEHSHCVRDSEQSLVAAAPKDHITATVLSIAGEVVLGPKEFARAGLVAEVRAELANLRPRQEVKLISDGCVLRDDYVAMVDDLLLSATFEQRPPPRPPSPDNYCSLCGVCIRSSSDYCTMCR